MSGLKLRALHALKRLGLFALADRLTRRSLRIVCYHGIWLGEEGYPGDAVFMGRRTFRDRMRFIREQGFDVIDLNEAVRALDAGGFDRSLVITIDDGWYGTYREMFPVLREYGLKATLYCDTRNLAAGLPVMHVMARYMRVLSDRGHIGNRKRLDEEMTRLYREMFEDGVDPSRKMENLRRIVAYLDVDMEPYLESGAFSYMLPEHVREMHAGGVDIQLHSHSHTLEDFSEDVVCREVECNRSCLAEILGCDEGGLRHFCYPSGRYSDDIDGILRRNGIESATTCDRSMAAHGHNRYFLPRILDGENLGMIEFEAELCGFMHLVRRFRSVLRWG